jgi:fatty-acyl-CoA synthase
LSKPLTLSHAIEYAATHGQDRGYRFINNEKWNETFYSFDALERETRSLAASLQSLGLRKGDRVALILPDNDAFVLSFLAALRAGIVPVPIYPPTGLGQLAGYLENTRHIVAKSQSHILVTSATLKPLLGSVQSACSELRTVTTFSSLRDANATFSPVEIAPSDTAFLQFTSGSTSRPKGVVLTHQNLLANIRNIIELGLKADPSVDSGLSWLPLFHDMGLIGFVLAPLVHTIQVSFLPPLLFLKRPALWLQAMSRYKGTITFGPNFAYALAVKRIKASELIGVDLSSWRVAGCGAEPIRPDTLEAFADTFGKYGFKKDAFVPAYGMAESTLAISFSQGLPIDCVKSTALWSEGRAEISDGTSDDTIRIVACGKAFEEHLVGVFSPDDDVSASPLPERQVGELRLQGPSVTSGYFEDPELTKNARAGAWFRTGDLGYLANGNVHICGRSKEVIIINGRNFYPQDIEWEASQVDGVRKGNVIAFGSGGSERERENVVLAFETSIDDASQRAKICSLIRARVQDAVGITLDEVVALAAGALPKTSSGKLQRTKARDLYDQGELAQRKSARESDRVDQVKQIAKSQLEYLKLSLFGSRAKRP